MDDGKISISWDDLKTRRVENRLREQQAVARNRAYSQLQEDALPQATAAKTSLWQNTFVVSTAFGLLGGLLAWLSHFAFVAILPWFGTQVLHYDPRAQEDAQGLIANIHQVEAARDLKQYTPRQAEIAIEQIKVSGGANPYFKVLVDPTLSKARRDATLRSLEEEDKSHQFTINVIQYGLFGLMIGLCLALAEPLSQRKSREALINGGAGALLGLTGGIAAAEVSTRIAEWTAKMVAGQPAWVNTLAVNIAIFGTLGLFLGIGSGLVVWNPKKLLIGMCGGLVGGIVGGALFDPMKHLTGSDQDARLIGLMAIGGVAALGTGFLENAAKAGWLKVTTGIIAGKQFILYRNPTYIGSAPDCQIYLFKDPKVGKRHAAIHLTPTGIEIEDLPLGVETFVNGKPVKRSPLKNGDRIAVGSTQFVFQERRPVAGKN